MKRFFTLLLISLAVSATQAQQLPDPHFEDWSSEYNGDKQLKDWHGSNVSQVGFKFTFMYQKEGRTGYAAYVANKEVGAAGITEVGPGYISLGTIWQYIDGLKVNSATAGTDGGIKFTYRPDTVSVWIKRTGDNTADEDFHILYYSWKGTSKGNKYKAKDGSCSGDTHTNEESDIRIALDHNECGTAQSATQVSEAWYRARAQYNDWTQIKVPVYYMNDQVPEMCNVIFSSGNYPNYRANYGLNKGNAIYVDDIELIYSAKIQTLLVGDKEWKGFDPNSTEEQVYSLGEKATTIPTIVAKRGAGQLTNAHNETVPFSGRTLSSKEMTITNGEIDGKPTTIKVTSDDGKQTHTYKIKFVRAASTNANLAGIEVNGKALDGFRPTLTNYSYALPYGTKDAPIVTATPQEDKQVITIDQATSVTGTATIHVMAADGKTKKDYTVVFSVAQLADNTLQNILVNGVPVPGFTPNLSVYKVSLPIGTTEIPKVEAVSAYPAGAQTITYMPPAQVEGGTYKISVTTPGNSTPKVYSLNFKLEASTYSYLKSLKMGDYIENFDPKQFIYYINLPLGTTTLPEITYEKGDPYQTVEIVEGGLNGTTCVNVKAASGDMSVYKLVVATTKSEYSLLDMIYVGGDPLPGFDKNVTNYDYYLPIGTTAMPAITVDKGDEFEQVTILSGGLNGTTRISVSAQNGNTTIYQIAFSVVTSSDASLRMIYVGGDSLKGFDPDVTEYSYPLPIGTTQHPVVTYDEGAYQTITVRDGGVNGDYKITVRPQTGASKTYTIKFSVAKSSNTTLQDIRINNVSIEGFRPDSLYYIDTLPAGVSTIPTVTYVKAEESQRVLSVLDNTTQKITVTAEDGAKQTYEILFVIQKSENAYLKMIYLDSVPLAGFDSATLSYHVVLNTLICPQITVDKAEGQQVVIVAPESVGQAQIVVTPESGSSNTYILDFLAPEQTEVELDMIYVNGVAIEGYHPANHAYTVHYEGAQSVVTYDMKAGQQVQELVDGELVSLHVTNGDKHGVYEITCVRDLRSDATLKNILLDGVGLTGFTPLTVDYTVNLPAGSQLPVITFVKNTDTEVTFFGQAAPNKFAIHVQAEDGSENTYTITFVIAPYSDVALANIELSRGTLDFAPETTIYNVSIGTGETLPDVTITSKLGQTTMLYQVTDSRQDIVVMAESGATRTYQIIYTRAQSGNSLLHTILLNGDTLKGFEPTKYNYVDTLAWRTRVIPNIQAVGQLPNQVITTYFCAVNGTARIHVEADNGAFSDYTIAFPVRKSSNTVLEEFYLGEEIPGVEFQFKPSQTDYVVALPHQTTAVPAYSYNQAEPEQLLEVISRPLGDTTKIIVHAENGDTRTYNFYFYAEETKEENRLQSIYIRELDQYLSLKDKTQRMFEVTMPYGSRSLTVEYEKMFLEQTVMVQPGGVLNPTLITVKGNREGDVDVVYTITPTLTTQNPAVLTDIKINGASLPEFASERYSYIVNVTAKPTLTYVLKSGAAINILDQTSKHWSAEVTYGEYTNRYDVWYYYANEVVPNAHFTEWTNCATYTSAKKPTGWNTIADALGQHSGFGKFNPDALVVKDGTSVALLQSKYSTPGGGTIPGFITLGSVSGQWAVAGGSSFVISGGISFHNSPDIMQINYKMTDVMTSNSIEYALTGSNGAKTLRWTNSSTSSSYSTFTYNLADANSAAGDPTLLNITLNSFYQVNGHTDTSLGATTPKTYVDWLAFIFNNTLTSMTVNGIAATKNDNAFTATLASAEDTDLPKLVFTGEVSDQAQKVAWSAPTVSGDKETRKATITNFGEDSQSSAYTLSVIRPLSTNNSLDSLYVGGELVNLSAAETELVRHLASSVHQIPDVQPFPGSKLQTVTTTYADSTYTIVVTPEYGEAKTYTVRFVTDLSDNTELNNISGVDGFVASTREYEVTPDKIAALRFEKAMDGQTVTMHNGLFTVVAENGTVGYYKVIAKSTKVETSAQITNFVLDGVDVQGFGGTNYDITHNRPSITAFVRTDEQDSVIYTQTSTKMTWEVIGAIAARHTYTLTYPTTLSDNALLANILVNGDSLADFNPQITDYTIYSDTAIALQAIGAEDKQNIQISQVKEDGVLTYTILVTAANGVAKKTYTLKVAPIRLDVATLDGIYLDGVLIDGFRQDSFVYVVTLPTPAAKVVEPQMPSFTYLVTDSKETVSLELGELNTAPTFFMVRSGSGVVEQTYSVTVMSEPSHNADLTGIVVNGQPVDRFEVGRHYYSVVAEDENIVITWSSDDHFQHVTLLEGEDFEYTIRVVAQDGVTTQDYVLDVYLTSLSNDVTLRDILLDGMEFKDFQRALNEKLEFSPMKNQYDINLPAGTTILPEVSASMQMEGQTVVIRQEGLNIYLDVTAKDGVSKNTYTLNFYVPLSSNANLSMIFCNGDPIADFTPDYYYYLVTLPVGTHTLPEIVSQKGQNGQTVDAPYIEEEKNRATIRVTAEDGHSTSAYVVVFEFERSQADTLEMIYASGDTLPGFEPHRFVYNLELPVGTTAFPLIEYVAADQWQTIRLDTIAQADNQLTRQIYVQSEYGNSKTYTISYTILPSSIDTLMMIDINGTPLQDFNSQVQEYYYALENTATELPLVGATKGDPYQTINAYQLEEVSSQELPDSVKAVNQKVEIHVQAQDGHTRIYTVHFSMKKSTEAGLNMIMLNGKNLSGFVSEVTYYSGKDLALNCQESVPVVTVAKKHEAQKVEISVMTVEAAPDTVYIDVTAEDGKHQERYTIIFADVVSENYFLSNLLFTDGYYVPFDSIKQDYEIDIPYGVDTIPTVLPIQSDICQTVEVGDPIVIDPTTTVQYITVHPYNNEQMSYQYSITYYFHAKGDALASAIFLRGQLVEDFNKEQFEYVVEYEDGTSKQQMCTEKDVTVLLSDPDAFYVVRCDTSMTIYVDVTAQDTTITNTYRIEQIIGLSRNNYLASISLGGELIRDFDPETTFYTYYVLEGGTPPLVEAEAQHSKAEVSVLMKSAGDTTVVTCYAENGDARKYYIYFAYTTINSSLNAKSQDVLIKRLDGFRIFVATIRHDVDFALYDQQGHLVYYNQNMPICDQNNAILQPYANGVEVLTDVVDESQGVTIELRSDQVYLYGFYSPNGCIAHGKFVIVK